MSVSGLSWGSLEGQPGLTEEDGLPRKVGPVAAHLPHALLAGGDELRDGTPAGGFLTLPVCEDADLPLGLLLGQHRERLVDDLDPDVLEHGREDGEAEVEPERKLVRARRRQERDEQLCQRKGAIMGRSATDSGGSPGALTHRSEKLAEQIDPPEPRVERRQPARAIAGEGHRPVALDGGV